MPTLPEEYITLIMRFAPIFTKRIWRHVQVLVSGAILAPGKRTVTSVLRVMGLDDTIERRRGAKIKAKGIYRDPVRSSHSHMVKASGLRWLSLMLLAPIPWAQRVWALPFLTALTLSERFYEKCVRGHKKLTDWEVRRWLPQRALVVVADSSFAAILLLWRMAQLANPICMITRLRLDKPAPPREPGQIGRPRLKGARLPKLTQVLQDVKTAWTTLIIENWYGAGRRKVEIVSGTAVWYHTGKPPLPIRWVLIRDPKGKFKPQALLCTDPKVKPLQILQWFMMRWRLEVTFQEVRTHLGVETQRQWSDLAIARTTPALLGLFSLVTLLAHRLTRRGRLPIRQAAWYVKPLPTFSDALASVRYQLWHDRDFHMSLPDTDMAKIPRLLLKRFIDALCYAA